MALPFRLMLITDGSMGLDAVLTQVARVLETGAPVAVQHRHPEASTRVYLREARAVHEVCQRYRAPLFVNSRLEVAMVLGAHLHLGAKAMPVHEARPHLRAGTWVSCAVHGLDEAQPGADLALVSPVFSPRSKVGDTRPTLGAAGFNELAARLTCPAFALGGITVENARALTGAAGLAAVNGFDALVGL